MSLITKEIFVHFVIQKSKGLEFKNVFIMNIDENYPYLYKAKYKKLDKNVLLETNVEEERRLLYVAMTRAEERLYIY